MEKNENKKAYIGHEFEAIKYRHEDQVKVLLKMTDVDLKLFSGYLTIQLAFGSFLTNNSAVLKLNVQVGLLLVELSMAVVCSIFLWNNYQRRIEVVNTIRNCNEALGFTRIDQLSPGSKIDSVTKFRPWVYWYITGVAASTCGIIIILFG